MDAIDFFLVEDCDFHYFRKLGPTTENSFSYLLGVIWNYVKKSHSYIVDTSEGL